MRMQEMHPKARALQAAMGPSELSARLQRISNVHDLLLCEFGPDNVHDLLLAIGESPRCQ